MKKEFVVAAVTATLALGGNLEAKTTQSQPSNKPYAHFLNQALTTTQNHSLYENCLAGLTLLGLGQIEQAEQILTGLKTDWEQAAFQPTGLRLWLALFALQYEAQTQQGQFIQWAESLIKTYCQSGSFYQLPVIAAQPSMGIDWRQLVSTEDALLGLEVLNIASVISQNQPLQKTIETKRQALLQKHALLTAFPENSFLIFTFDAQKAPEALSRCKVYKLNAQTYLLTDAKSLTVDGQTNVSDLIPAYWEEVQQLNPKHSIAKYEQFRSSIRSLEKFLVWKNENISLNYRSALTSQVLKGAWYLPEKSKRNVARSSVEKIALAYFQDEWTPFSLKREPASGAFNEAKFQLMAGNVEKAEELANKIVSEEEADAEKKAASWFILGKVYYDKAHEANRDFKFDLGNHFESKSRQAFQKVAQNYSSSTLAQPKGKRRNILEIIKQIYQ